MKRFLISRLPFSHLSVAGFLVALAACSHEDQAKSPSAAQAAPPPPPTMAEQYGSALNQPGGMNPPPPQANTNAPPPEEGQQGTMTEQGAGTETRTTTVDVSSLSDAQIASVLNAINAGQIESAQLAGSSAAMPQVRQFARQMLTTHRDLQHKLDAVYSAEQITPSPNALSNQIQNDDHNRLAAMQDLHGKDFDRVFLDDEVRSHNNALELLDRTIPNVHDTQLKAELQDVRAHLDSHLKEAEVLQQQLQQGATNRQGGPPSHAGGSMNVSPAGNPAQMR